MFEISGNNHLPYLRIVESLNGDAEAELSSEMQNKLVLLIWNELSTMVKFHKISIQDNDENKAVELCAEVYNLIIRHAKENDHYLSRALRKPLREISDDSEALFALISLIGKEIESISAQYASE